MADMIQFNPPVAVGGYGTRIPGARAFFYDAGTLTPRAVFADVNFAIAHASPLVADAEGVFPPVFINGGGAVKVDVRDPFTGLSLPGFPMDPAFVVPAEGGGARNVSFTPTAELAFNNVQDAIVGAATTAASGFLPFGLGVTGNAGLLATLDATSTASGAYRYDTSTTGTFPAGVTAAAEGVVTLWRQGANDAVQVLYTLASEGVWVRRLSGGTWQGWAPLWRALASQAQAEAGTNAGNALTPLGLRQGLRATGSAPVFACRAWVSFNGGTGAIFAQGNVSSVVRNGVGDYTITFATALPDANYAMSGAVDGVVNHPARSLSFYTGVAPLAGSVRIATGLTGSFAQTGRLEDVGRATVMIIR